MSKPAGSGRGPGANPLRHGYKRFLKAAQKAGLLAALAALLLAAPGCFSPPRELDKPATPPDAPMDRLVGKGQGRSFQFQGSIEGRHARLSGGFTLVALRYAAPDRARQAWKARKAQLKAAKHISVNLSMEIPSGCLLRYAGAKLHGYTWTSGVWLFSLDGPSLEAVRQYLAASPLGGMGAAGWELGLLKYLALLVLAVLFLVLPLVFWLAIRIARRSGKAEPAPGVAPISKRELMDRLLALDGPDTPFRVEEDQYSDLVVQWNLVDAKWWGLFAQSGLRKTYRLRLGLDPASNQVFALEESARVSWSGGLGAAPSLSWSKESFRGVSIGGRQRGAAWGLKAPTGQPGQVYQYDFDVRRIKEPVMRAVSEAGWRYLPAFSRKAVRRRS